MSSPPSTISRFAQPSPSSQQHGGSLALVKRLKLLASDVDNQPVVCRRGILPSLLLFLQNTDPEVRHTAAETLVSLSSHPENPDCLCRERGLVQIVVSSYRSSKESDPVFHELCGTIIKNLESALHPNALNNNSDNNNTIINHNNVMLSPSNSGKNNNNNSQQGQQRSGSTYTQLEFLSGSRSRDHGDNNNDGQEHHNLHSPAPHNNDEQRTPSPNVGGGAAATNNSSSAAEALLMNSATASMTTTRRYNPRTRQSHFINGGMPNTAQCRNVQLRLSQLIPSKRQQLVECLHTTRGVISYTIDLPTKNLTVFLSVPAQNLVTTLKEDGFSNVEVVADVEVQMSNEHNERRQYNDEQQNGGGINLNDYYDNDSEASKKMSEEERERLKRQHYDELSEYKKSLMIGEMNERGCGSLISRIQYRKKMEEEKSMWSTVWETLKNVFW